MGDEPFYMLMVPGGRVFRIIVRHTTNVWEADFKDDDPVEDRYYCMFVEDVGTGFRSYSTRTADAFTFKTKGLAISSAVAVILHDVMNVDGAVEEGNDHGSNEAEQD